MCKNELSQQNVCNVYVRVYTVWVLFTIAQGAIEAVEINYIFVDKNQQTETDNIFFLTLKINSECHCRNMAILDLWNSVSSVNVIVQFDIKKHEKKCAPRFAQVCAWIPILCWRVNFFYHLESVTEWRLRMSSLYCRRGGGPLFIKPASDLELPSIIQSWARPQPELLFVEKD